MKIYIRNSIPFIVIILLVLSCGNTKKLKENTNTEKSQVTKTLTGNGAETQRITLNEGAAIFKFNYKGPRNFVVWLKDKNAKEIELIVNDIGSSSGSKSVNIENDGTYILDVEAEGSWTIEIK